MSSMQLNASKCPDPDERPPLSEAYLVQYVLDTCANVQEAIQAASVVRLSQNECASHYLVADGTGDCAALEFLDGQFVYYNSETLPVKALANAPYAAGITFIEQDVIPLDNPGESVERVASAADKIKGFRPGGGVSAVEYSLEVLTQTVVAPKKCGATCSTNRIRDGMSCSTSRSGRSTSEPWPTRRSGAYRSVVLTSPVRLHC